MVVRPHADSCDAGFAAQLSSALVPAAPLIREEQTCESFTTPLPASIRWLDKRTDPTTRCAVRAEASTRFAAVRDSTLARSRHRYANPPDAGRAFLDALRRKTRQKAIKAAIEKALAE